MRPGVYVFRPVDETGESHAALEAAGCRVVVARPDEAADSFLSGAHDVHALLGATYRGGRMDRSLLERFPELRIVSKYTIGVDDVDIDAATALGVLVTHCPTEANWGGVAEGTLAYMLSWLKKVRERDAQVKAGGWRSDALQGIYLGARADGHPGITIGIVGLGRIGRRVADLLAPWRVRLVASDPYVEANVFERHGVERVDLRKLLAESDVVSVHCSLTAETVALIDAAAIACMKPGALLINTARGAIVDLEAVCDGLGSHRLGGAVLDVLPMEPPPPDARIFEFGDRVLLSPHMVAANEGGTLSAAIPWATDATLAALRGQVPEHVFNAEVVSQWRRRFGGRSLL